MHWSDNSADAGGHLKRKQESELKCQQGRHVQAKADAANAIDLNAVVLRTAVLRAIERGDPLHDMAAETVVGFGSDGAQYVLSTTVSIRKAMSAEG